MRHFLDRDWMAPNVMRVAVDPSIAGRFADLAAAPLPDEFASVSPPWESDIRWISAVTPSAFARFEQAFAALDVARHVAPYVAVDEAIRLYQGFVVVRSRCRAANFHTDWRETGNQAFTLLTPISDVPAGFGLSFKTLTGDIRHYDYRHGEALIFGDNFLHSTAPGSSDEPVALLSFTFGTDRMEDWQAIRKTAAYQGGMVRRPDGRFE